MLNHPFRGNTGSNQSTYSSPISVGELTYTDGTHNTAAAVYHSYTGSVDAEAFTKFLITGRYTISYISLSAYPINGYRVVVGYREGAFTETTYDLPGTLINTNMLSLSVASGVPTVAVVNTSASNITVNEVTLAVKVSNSSSVTPDKILVFAGFHFPDITLAPGDSYTFTFSHKNS